MRNIQNNLPQGWDNAKLKEVSLLRNEKVEPNSLKKKPYISLEHIESGSNHLIDHGYSEDVKSLKSIFYAGDVLYGKLRPYLNKVCQPNFDGVCSTDILVFGPSPAIENRFLLKLLSQRSTVEYANSHAKGINLPRISSTDLGELMINLPPFNEQKRIVTRIEELQARSRRASEALEAIPDLLDQLRQAILAAAIAGHLTADWRKDNKNVESATTMIERLRMATKGIKTRRGVPDSVSMTDIVANWDLPETWGCYSTAELLRCGAFLDVKDGNHGANHPKLSEFTETGLPFITATQVNNYRIDYDGAHKLSGKPLERIRVGFAKSGDVIYTHKGSIGRVALVDRDCVLTPQTTYYRVNPNVLVNGFVMFYLASKAFSEQVNVVKGQTTRDFVPISEQYLLFHRVPPLTEQKEINRRVERLFAHVDRLEARYQMMQTQMDQLMPSILAKAFRGELVPQDPNDEPASILLDRIRKEKANPMAEPKVKRKGKKMKAAREEQRDILMVLRKSGRALTPEEVFAAAGFDEAAVDTFYEQLRAAIDSKKIREIREGKTIRLEAVGS